MKVVILAGGRGTRLSEETSIKPKPMVEIGGKPILWHIMNIYSYYGFNDFIICLGYKGEVIKDFFVNYYNKYTDLCVDLSTNTVTNINTPNLKWKIHLIDTGLDVMTGGRLKRVEKYIDDNTFLMTYGDGVSDVNIRDLVNFHLKHGKQVTMTAVQPKGRFGSIDLSNDNLVISMEEKPRGDRGWINGGFFAINKEALDTIKDDQTTWERDPLQEISSKHQLMAYKHDGFWEPMDTLNDKISLEKLWDSGKPPWKIW